VVVGPTDCPLYPELNFNLIKYLLGFDFPIEVGVKDCSFIYYYPYTCLLGLTMVKPFYIAGFIELVLGYDRFSEDATEVMIYGFAL
jgi:hypothetical protein